MSINTQLIKGLFDITDHGTQAEDANTSVVYHYEQPMNNVVIRTESALPQKSLEVPFRKNPLPCLEFTYSLSCDTVISVRNGPGDWCNNHITSGIQSLRYRSEFNGIAATDSSIPIRVIHLFITPQKLAQLLGPGNNHLVGTIINKAAPGSNGRLNTTPISPITTSIIHQIFDRDGASPADSLFLKGKILELLSHEVELLCGPSRKQTILQPEDVVKLQTARTIMMESMSTPPSISELARKVCLNEKKIKQGFKELYGTTVYGFLRYYRMEQAKLLFDRDYKSVTDVACAVGYSNVSHFGDIFRHHHGVRPGEYLRSLKEDRMAHHLYL